MVKLLILKWQIIHETKEKREPGDFVYLRVSWSGSGTRAAQTGLSPAPSSGHSSCSLASEMGAGNLPCCAGRQWELWAVASNSAPRGHTNFIYFLPNPKGEISNLGFQSLSSMSLFMQESLKKLITWYRLSQTSRNTSKKRMFRMTLILFTLNSQVV